MDKSQDRKPMDASDRKYKCPTPTLKTPRPSTNQHNMSTIKKKSKKMQWPHTPRELNWF